MMSGDGFGVALEEVVQDVQQAQRMPSVAALLRLPDVIDNHVAHSFGAALLLQKAPGESRRQNLVKVFVFGDGADFFSGQAHKAMQSSSAIISATHTAEPKH